LALSDARDFPGLVDAIESTRQTAINASRHQQIGLNPALFEFHTDDLCARRR
jgi:hypothetical protein